MRDIGRRVASAAVRGRIPVNKGTTFEAANLPLGTVKSHVLRGSEKLKRILARMDGDD